MNKYLLKILIGILIYPYYSFSQIYLEEINFNGGITKEINKYIHTPSSLKEFNNKFIIGPYIGINARFNYNRISSSIGLSMPSIGYKGRLNGGGWEHTTKHFMYLGLGFTVDYKLILKKKSHVYAGLGLIRLPRVSFGTLNATGSSSQSEITSNFRTYSYNNRGYILTLQSSYSKKLYGKMNINFGVQGGLGFSKLFATNYTYYLSKQDFINKNGHSHILETKGDFIAMYIGIQYYINKKIIK